MLSHKPKPRKSLLELTLTFAFFKCTEFITFTLVATSLLILEPGVYYPESSILESLSGGMAVVFFFFIFAAYLAFSLPIYLIAEFLSPSAGLIATVCAGFMLIYSAIIGASADSPLPTSFWLAWLGMGAASLFSALIAIKACKFTIHLRRGN